MRVKGNYYKNYCKNKGKAVHADSCLMSNEKPTDAILAVRKEG